MLLFLPKVMEIRTTQVMQIIMPEVRITKVMRSEIVIAKTMSEIPTTKVIRPAMRASERGICFRIVYTCITRILHHVCIPFFSGLSDGIPEAYETSEVYDNIENECIYDSVN